MKTKSQYNNDEIITWIERKGIDLYGRHFKILETDHPIIHKLIAYFLKDEPACLQYDIDLNKGIMLSGPVGCGKTSLMNLMKHLTPSAHKFSVKPCRDISFEFIKDGYQVIHKYGKSSNIYCFDDLGIEQNIKHFGNECNTMAEILLSRYDHLIYSKVLTHGTTNLNANELETMYGNRVRSRLREMFNLISFPASAKDKRK